MYEVEFKLEAQEDLTRLDKHVAQRILKKIQWLAENFDELSPEALKGKWRGKYKFGYAFFAQYNNVYILGQEQFNT